MMTPTANLANEVASLEEIQQGWHDLNLRVEQLETENTGLEAENKSLRHLLERVIEHRQKSHGELVLLLTALVSKLPINDVGAIVARLVEHNTHVNEVLAALAKGKAEAQVFQPTILKALDQTKRELRAALKPAVEELIQLQTPLEAGTLQGLVEQPDTFFSPPFLRANRCFIKGHVPKERIVREFGEPALVFFNDLTTDPKLNPNPKADEIVLGFKCDFETLFQQHPNLLPERRQQLFELYQRVQRSKTPCAEARAQRNTFTRLSFLLELLHYYENENTESPEVTFAQRLPALIEQLVLCAPQDALDEKLIGEAEQLLAFIISPEHRQAVVNNIGKTGTAGKILRYVLTLRAGKVPELDQVIAEFLKVLLPPGLERPPRARALAAVLRLVRHDMQRMVVLAILDTERLRAEDAQALGRALAEELKLGELEAPKKTAENVPAEVERQLAWEKIRLLLAERADPAAVAAAFRGRLHARYDADELKQSWITLIEANPIMFIRTFCQLPYLPDGSTDPIARTVMESYLSRLLHEKYAGIYHKVVNSLRNMHHANPHSPTLQNFMALVKWVDAAAAARLGADIGMAAPA